LELGPGVEIGDPPVAEIGDEPWGLEEDPNALNPNFANPLEPNFEVTRTISLGRQEKVLTSVVALNEIGSPLSLALPLIPGERPTSQIQATWEHKALLNFSAATKAISFASDLTLDNSTLTLTAAEGPYREVWSLDAANLWAVKVEGFNPIVNVSPLGYWKIVFQRGKAARRRGRADPR
jgi:hypothetical protein